MQIGGRTRPLPVVADIPAALRVVTERQGQRPAVTVLRSGRRDEQGFLTLSQWVAKGAHLLEVDAMLEPGDRVALIGPPSWMAVAFAHAAWWVGAEIAPDGPARVAVVHDAFDPPEDVDDVYWFGDEIDGSSAVHPESSWALEVQAFPDQPPLPRGGKQDAAILGLSQEQALEEARGRPGDGTAGLLVPERPDPHDHSWMISGALRPVVTGSATVLCVGVGAEAAEPERVQVWLDR